MSQDNDASDQPTQQEKDVLDRLPRVLVLDQEKLRAENEARRRAQTQTYINETFGHVRSPRRERVDAAIRKLFGRRS